MLQFQNNTNTDAESNTDKTDIQASTVSSAVSDFCYYLRI